MKRILILYFSGVGVTKKVAQFIHAQLSTTCDVDIISIESEDIPDINNYDSMIIGTPVHHAAPARLVTSYLNAMPRLINETPAFIFNTRGLCSLNTNRILAKQLQKKNIVTIMDRAYRGPASDGSIVAPFIKRFFEYEKNLEKKIASDCADFLELLVDDTQGYIPRFQLGSIINAPNKVAGQLITLKIQLYKDRCDRCKKCISLCPYKAISKDIEGYPLFISKDCENCYRCIHHCPNLALSLSKKNPPKKVIRDI